MIFPIICIIILLLFYRRFLLWTQGFPPGPLISFPILGHLPFMMGKDPLGILQKWMKKFGKIYSIQFGNYNAVIITDYQMIKEAFNKIALSGRPDLRPLLEIAGGAKRGLVGGEGKAWEEQRHFTLKHLKSFGFSKHSMEGLILKDVRKLIDIIRAQINEPIVTRRLFNTTILASLWNIITGDDISNDEAEFKKVLDLLNRVIEETDVDGPVFFLPWLTKYAPTLSGWNRFAKSMGEAHNFIQTKIEELQQDFQIDGPPRGLIDVFLKEIRTTTDPSSSFFGEEGEKQMLIVIFNLFVAGGETTSNSLNWALLYLSHYPQVLIKFQDEIDRILGSNPPSLKDFERMPYAEGVIREVFRASSLAPFGIFHSTTEDLEFHGFKIPKKTLICSNLFGVHYDEKTWVNPKEFYPERHLTLEEDGSYKLNPKAPPIIPFSIGRRNCPGEAFAFKNFFLFLTSICQNFDFSFDPQESKPGIFPAKTSSILRFPDPFKIIFRERNSYKVNS